MRNVTIALDDETAAWLRVYAAQHDTSVSRLVANMLADKRRSEDAYEKAYREWLAEPPLPLTGPPERYPTREELYDRPVLRRR
jgi:plasmid stability protein